MRRPQSSAGLSLMSSRGRMSRSVTVKPDAEGNDLKAPHEEEIPEIARLPVGTEQKNVIFSLSDARCCWARATASRQKQSFPKGRFSAHAKNAREGHPSVTASPLATDTKQIRTSRNGKTHE